jgi:hypothetical protein
MPTVEKQKLNLKSMRETGARRVPPMKPFPLLLFVGFFLLTLSPFTVQGFSVQAPRSQSSSQPLFSIPSAATSFS